MSQRSTKLAVAEAIAILGMLIAGVYAFAHLDGRVSELKPAAVRDFERAQARADEADDKLAEANQKLGEALVAIEKARTEAQAKLEADRLPVGSIIASVLKPPTFTSIHADWVLCDGRAIDGSVLFQLGEKRVPDLRGLFLRGINAGRNDPFSDPEGERIAGAPQRHQYEQHNHAANIHRRKMSSSKGGTWLYTNQGWQDGPHPISENRGGAETRPNNAAVYYFCRVN